MAKTFILHDESVNTKGFRLLTAGANLDEFIKNPVGLLNHNDWDMPIIRWENIRKEGGKILADAVFDEQDPKAVEVMGKVERDFVRMASIGAWPPEEVSDDPMLKLPEQSLPTVTKWTVREASIVTIGSNHNAMVFYDRETLKPVNLNDPGELLKLMDTPKTNQSLQMNELNKLLNLADMASEADRLAAMRTIISDRDRLKSENVTLTSRIDELNKSEKDKQKAEAVTLIDAAIKDGRLDAKGKEAYVKLFDSDYESAKSALEALPKRSSVTGKIEESTEQNAIELADFQKKEWDQIDKEGKLVVLKDKYPDVYEQKFEKRFGVKPKKQ